MGRVLTNNTSVAYAIEDTIGTLPGSPTWFVVEPNDLPSLGSDISRVTRDPITKDRQMRKGEISDLDSAIELPADLTYSHMTDFVEGMFFATAKNTEMSFRASDATSVAYTISAATATQAGKLQFVSGGYASLVYARGYENSGNNGLKVLSADTGTSDTTITVSGGLTTETAPTNALVELCGIRAEQGDLSITVSAGVATITSGNNGASNNIDFTTLGLTVGQFIHVGGLTTANQFSAGAGYGRVKTIAAGTLTLDKLDSTLATDTGSGETVDLLFGQFVRNVSVDDADFLARSYQFEVGFDGLDTDSTAMWEYIKGNYANEITIDTPLTDKATMSVKFVGTDTDNPTDTQKTNASSPVSPVADHLYNTSSSFKRLLRIADSSNTNITDCFKTATVNINNNVSPEKCIGTLGASYMNYGMFEVSVDADIVYSNSVLKTSVRANSTVTMDWGIGNDQGGIFFDVPSATLDDGGYTFNKNESTTIKITANAFKDATLGTSMSVSLFPVVP